VDEIVGGVRRILGEEFAPLSQVNLSQVNLSQVNLKTHTVGSCHGFDSTSGYVFIFIYFHCCLLRLLLPMNKCLTKLSKLRMNE
jgi:hypothetical protein